MEDNLKQKSSFLRIFKVWLKIASMVMQVQIMTRWGGIAFFIGKIIRFLFFFVFIFSVVSKTGSLAGFTKEQVILFYLVFNLIDILTQCLYRGVYRFRRLIVNGDYDFDLLRPLPSFFRPIFGWTDILDFFTFVLLLIYFIFFLIKNSLVTSSFVIIQFLILFINSLFLAFSLHLIICAVCVLTTEIDHLIWIYRDITNTARFPTDVYGKGFRYFITFVIPVVVLITIPAKSILGLISWKTCFFVIIFNFVFFFLAKKFWSFALSKYSSASS